MNLLHKVAFVFTVLIELIVFWGSSCYGQLITFHPSVDSIFIVGSDVPGEIVFSLRANSSGDDTVTIRPLYVPMCTGFPPTITNTISQCYFLIKDSINSYHYVLSFRHVRPYMYDPITIHFDTAYYVIPGSITITLYAYLNELLIDSCIARFFSIETGLFVEPAPPQLIPHEFVLKQNYPNPFNGETQIEFSLVHSGLVRIDVYNLLGQKVNSILNEFRYPGYYKILWQTEQLPSGLYEIVLTSQNQRTAIKCNLLK